LKDDVTKRDESAKHLEAEAKCHSCTTLDDCFAKFTQQEEVIPDVSVTLSINFALI